MPVTAGDILFGADYVSIEIGGWWADLSMATINLEFGNAQIPEPSILMLMGSGLLMLGWSPSNCG